MKIKHSTSNSCPYAAHLVDISGPSPPVDMTDEEEHSDHDTSGSLDISESIARCPAFSQKSASADRAVSCPFRNATSQQDVQKIMMQVPPSHVQRESETAMQFKRALAAMHDVSHTNQEEQFKMVLSDCPFKNSYGSGDSFGQVIESLSMHSVLSQMADVLASEINIDSSSDDQGLSKQLKQGTAKSHKEAENVSFVRNFIKGKIDRDLYIRLIGNLYFVYDALEDELEKHASSHFPLLHEPTKLNRKSSLQDDLNFFLGNEWQTKVKPSTATAEYVQRIRNVGKSNPILLISHSYTRYLGDLSGGKVLQRVAKKALGLTPSSDGGVDGLRFYEFPLISEGPKSFKNSYRQKLDKMHLGSWQTNRLVSEANVAFVLNMRIFEELDCEAGVKGASVRPLKDALSYLVDLDGEEPSKKDEKCPFGFTGSNPHETETKGKVIENTNQARCPWPFIFFHDPAQGFRDWQTSVVISIILCYIYSFVSN